MRWSLPLRWGAARQEDWPAPAPPVHPIEQYWVLAFLLHVWVVLMFGTLQGGTARPGEGVWGSLTVALVGPPGQGEAATQAQAQGDLAPQAMGRQGRSDASLPDAGVTATDLPEAAEPAGGAPAEVSAQPEETPAPAATVDPPPQPQPPAPLPAPTPAAPEPAPAELVAAPPQPLQTLPEPAVVHEVVPEVVAAEVSVPAEPATAVLASSLPALAVPGRGEVLAPVAAPAALQQIARPAQRVPAAVKAPAPAASAVAQAPVPIPAPAPAPEVPTAVVAPTPATTPAPVPAPVLMRQLAAEAVPALARAPAFNPSLAPARPVVRPPELQILSAADRVGPPRRPVVQGQPDATTAAAPAASGVTVGDAQAPLSAQAPTPPASSARLILELPRGGAMASQGVRGAIQLVPPPPERKSKLGEAVDKAAKTDCREAYQKNGLLAVVPLVVDAVRDKGCRW